MENYKKYSNKKITYTQKPFWALDCENTNMLNNNLWGNKKNKEKIIMQLHSPTVGYSSSENLDLDIALKVKGAEINRLLEEVTVLEEDINKLRQRLIESIKDEKLLIEMKAKRLLRTL